VIANFSSAEFAFSIEIVSSEITTPHFPSALSLTGATLGRGPRLPEVDIDRHRNLIVHVNPRAHATIDEPAELD
jgi:hypothetical protein